MGQRIHLDRSQSRSLEDWVLSKREAIRVEKLDRHQIATQASKALGFAVTHCNVKRAMSTVGVPSQRAAMGPRVSGKPRPSNLIIVARALADIIDKLGETVPFDLAAYIASKDGK